MTNKPFSKRMLDSKKRVGGPGTHSYKWRFKQSPWKLFIEAITKPQNTILPAFGKKSVVLAITLLVVIAGGMVLYQGPLFHSYVAASPRDPTNILWQDNLGSTANWHVSANVVTCVNCAASGVSGFKLGSSGTAGIAISTVTVGQLSLASGRNLLVQSVFVPDNAADLDSVQWGYFLTTNNTVSNNVNYNPGIDPSVFLFVFQDSGGNIKVYVKSNPSDTLTDEHFPTFLSGSATIQANTQNYFITQLNYTGQSTVGANSGISLVTPDNLVSAPITTGNFPDFQLNQPYYFGMWELQTTHTPIDFLNSAATETYQPSPPNPGTLDTGGFFGPIIRALISVGVFIAQNIINFLAFLANTLFPVLATVFGILANALVGALNAIGNFFGLGNIGTTIQSFFTGIGNFLVNGVGAILSQITNAGSFVVNGITAFVNIAGAYWAKITSFFTALGNLLSIIGTVFNDFLSLGAFSGSLALFMDWTWGMYKTYDEGTEGFHRWLDFNENVFLKVGTVAYMLADHLFTVILKVKQLIVQWV